MLARLAATRKPSTELPQARLFRQLRWLALGRAALVASFTALVWLAPANMGSLLHSARRIDALLWTFSVGSALTALWLLWGTRARSSAALATQAYVQLAGDVALSAAVVLVTGGSDSVFSFLFSLTVINAAIILRRLGAFIFATSSALVMVALALGELGITSWPAPPNMPPPGWAVPLSMPLSLPIDSSLALMSRVHNVGVNVFAFFAVATLASTLAEQVRRTDAEHAETRSSLEELKALHRNIVNSVMSGLITVTLDGRITFFNRVAQQITGLQETQVLGRHISAVFPSLDFSSDAVLREAAYPSTRSTLEPLATGPTHLRWSISPLRDAHDEPIGYVLFVRDITEVLELEGRARRAEQLASIGALAAQVAHEIRNPLASISASVELLARQPAATAMSGRLMGIVRREVESLNAWIGDFLEFSKDWKLERHPVSLPALLRDTLEACAQEHPQARLDLELLCPAEDGSLQADPQRLRQVFWNLIRNAIEASPTESPRVVVRLHRRELPYPALLVDVVDWGTGIRPEDRTHIFEPFFTTKAKGTGLGLPTCLRITEAHGGDIDVRSEPTGTCFTVVLPLSSATAAITRDEPIPQAHIAGG